MGQPPDQPRVTIESAEGFVHVRFPGGQLDGVAVRELFEAAMQIDQKPPHLLVDLTDVTFVSSGGLGMLVTIRKRLASRGGRLFVAVPDDVVRRAFEVAGLPRVLSLFEDVDTAIAELRGA